MKKIKEYYFITGASKGIGKAFLELLIKNGCFVLVLVRNKKDMMQYKNNKNVIIFEGDICNNNIIKKVFDYVDKKKINIKYLINNAGQRQRKKFLRISSKDIKNIFDINYFSVFNITQKFVDHMKYKKYNASVVNISSIVGHLGFNELSGYGSTKAALNGLTKCLASEFNGKIRFNSINILKLIKKNYINGHCLEFQWKGGENPLKLLNLSIFCVLINLVILMVK